MKTEEIEQKELEMLNRGEHVAYHMEPGYYISCPVSGFYTEQRLDEPEWAYCPTCGAQVEFEPRPRGYRCPSCFSGNIGVERDPTPEAQINDAGYVCYECGLHFIGEQLY